MLQIIGKRCRGDNTLTKDLPPLIETPDLGLIHPVRYRDPRPDVSPFFLSPSAYLTWRKSRAAQQAARRQGFLLAAEAAPVVAVLLYRKHVITEQPYILDLLTMMEQQGIIPVPIFINGVEAHTVVRDLLTSEYEATQVSLGKQSRPKTYQERQAVRVDAIVNVSDLVNGW
jgi:magnesium chelatase subunit H